jgi:hypothetical protein
MPRNFKLEYERYQGKPEQIKNRTMRNAARREAAKDGRVRKGDGMDVDHVTPIAKGGRNGGGNTRVIPKSQNRSFPRTAKAKMR